MSYHRTVGLAKAAQRQIFKKQANNETGPWPLQELVPNYRVHNVERTADGKLVKRHDIELDGAASIYSCGLFDICADSNLMASVFGAASSPLIDWLTWELTNVKKLSRYYITHIGGEGAADGNESPGWVADCCEDGNTVEWGKCKYEIKGFGRLRRKSPTYCLDELGERLCETQPKYFLDQTMVEDDRDYYRIITMEQLYRDLACMIITGSSSEKGQFAGFDELINTGHVDPDTNEECTSMDAICVDWLGQDLNSSVGALWNGATYDSTADVPGIDDGTSIISALETIFTLITDYIECSSLGIQGLNTESGDIVLVGARNCLRCLLDAYVCWTVCAGGQYTTVNINNDASRAMRNELRASGLFGMGYIEFNGRRIHLLPHDHPCMYDDDGNCKLYLVTGSVGNTPTFYGQLYDHNSAQLGEKFQTLDGGRVLTWTESKNTCENEHVQMRPRLVTEAPWANAKITGVPCKGPKKTYATREANPVVAVC